MIDPMTWRTWKTRGLLLAFWTALALSYAASAVISSRAEGRATPWGGVLAWMFCNFYLWMLLTPLVAWLGRLGGKDGWRRFLAVHLPAGVLVALFHTVVALSAYWWISGPSPSMKDRTLVDFLRTSAVYETHLAWITYWVFVVALRAVASRNHLRDERLRNSHLETQLVQSQLQTLRVQLQPHFLFNTLNAISALALADPMQARAMISRLSDFLRLTLEERHAQQVPLSRELEFLECYLGIQQVRFRDRLVTHMDIAADTLGAFVPNMILQPLVENALHHGLLDKPERGTLQVMARREGDELRVEIVDDGLGLPPEGTTTGIGLGSTRTRLDMLFGGRATLALSRRDSGGTRVEVRLPYREQPA
ncbi:histidine kinase [Luteibacter aegosomatis]|uniref:sensor histidine kinase n=1 Tax=Luteibacter aegosomatis TaxID=2911537 RepID=UPI001FF91927|nr:histidine kinase [Luteibacter aegosomatis]UPG85608.1 histidine kinase [Luteibacter aegosomatis]